MHPFIPFSLVSFILFFQMVGKTLAVIIPEKKDHFPTFEEALPNESGLNDKVVFGTDVYYTSSNTFPFECVDTSYLTNLNKARTELNNYHKKLLSLFNNGIDDLGFTSEFTPTDDAMQLKDPYDLVFDKIKRLFAEQPLHHGLFSLDLDDTHSTMQRHFSIAKPYFESFFLEGKRQNEADKYNKIQFVVLDKKIHIDFTTLMTYELESIRLETQLELPIKKLVFQIKEWINMYSAYHAQKLNVLFYQAYDEYCKLDESIRKNKDSGRPSIHVLSEDYKAVVMQLNEGKGFYEASVITFDFNKFFSKCEHQNYIVLRDVAARNLVTQYKETIFFFTEKTVIDDYASKAIPQKEITKALNDPYPKMRAKIEELLKDITVNADAYLLKIDEAHKVMVNQLITAKEYFNSFIMAGNRVSFIKESIYFIVESDFLYIHFQSLMHPEVFQKLSNQNSLTHNSKLSLQELGRWIKTYSWYHEFKLKLTFYQIYMNYCDACEKFQKTKDFSFSFGSFSEDERKQLSKQGAGDKKSARNGLKINNEGDDEMGFGSQVAVGKSQSQGPRLNLNSKEKLYVTFPLVFNKRGSNPVQCSGTISYNELRASSEKGWKQHYDELLSIFEMGASNFNSDSMNDAKQTETLHTLIRRKILEIFPKEMDNKLTLEIEKTLEQMMAQVAKADQVFNAFFHYGKMEAINDIENQIYFNFLEKSIVVRFLPFIHSLSLKELMNNDLFNSHEALRSELVVWFDKYTKFQESRLTLMFYQEYANYCLFSEWMDVPEKKGLKSALKEMKKMLGDFFNAHQEGGSGGKRRLGESQSKYLDGGDVQPLLHQLEEMEKSFEQYITSTSTGANNPRHLKVLKEKYLNLLDKAKSVFDQLNQKFPQQGTTTLITNIKKGFQSLKNILTNFSGENLFSKNSSEGSGNLLRNMEMFADSWDSSGNKNKKKWQ